MAINWPNSPTEGTTHSEQGQTWTYTGGVWVTSSGGDGGFLPTSGGTLTGPLIAEDSINVQGGFVAENVATFQGATTFGDGLESNANIDVIAEGDKAVVFGNAVTPSQASVGVASGELTLRRLGATFMTSTATGALFTLDVSVSGNATVSGVMTLGNEPTAADHAATKSYVDSTIQQLTARIEALEALVN